MLSHRDKLRISMLSINYPDSNGLIKFSGITIDILVRSRDGKDFEDDLPSMLLLCNRGVRVHTH